MKIVRNEFTVGPFPRGFHIITDLVIQQCSQLRAVPSGLAHIFIKHTSASLSINENADPSVRVDLEKQFRELVPDNAAHYSHVFEGPDDMSAHIKTSLLGNSISLPVVNGGFDLGTWQGIYLCEHRENAGPRQLVITLIAED